MNEKYSTKVTAYAELATETIAPVLHRLWPPGGVTAGAQGLDDQSLLYMAGSQFLLPLCSPEFLATLPEDRLVALLAGRWEGYVGAVSDDASRLVIDLVLTASYEQLGRGEDAQQAAARVQCNPAGGTLLGVDDVRQMIHRARQDGSRRNQHLRQRTRRCARPPRERTPTSTAASPL